MRGALVSGSLNGLGGGFSRVPFQPVSNLNLDQIYRVDARLAELSFGEWEGLTYAEVMMRDKHIVDRREGDKWHFLPPGGESYQQVAVRVGAWYAAAERDTVVAAHGGTARLLRE